MTIRCLLVALFCSPLLAQDATQHQILERVAALEKQNQELKQEIETLKQQLQDAHLVPSADQKAPTLPEQVDVVRTRVEEQAQTKVESSQKFPLRLDGTLLFNAFWNSQGTPAYYGLLSGPAREGATVRQTLLGVQFDGPSLPGDGSVHGELNVDFWSGLPTPGENWVRLREASLSFDWKDTSFSVGQQKPLVSPYQPESLAEVGVPPLAGAGNLWYWLPEARLSHTFAIGESSGVDAQVAGLETMDSRPAFEGRVALWHSLGDQGRVEIAPGVHISDVRVDGDTVRSRAGTLDWLWTPDGRWKLTGAFFHGNNLSGVGSLDLDAMEADVYPRALHSTGGWSGLTIPATSRLSFNLFGGFEQDSGNYSGRAHNYSYAGNAMYHVGPNVVIAFEAEQVRLLGVYASEKRNVINHYDLALGYLF